MDVKFSYRVPFCTGCGLLWIGPHKSEERCWCEPSPGVTFKDFTPEEYNKTFCVDIEPIKVVEDQGGD